ncbi:MAG: sugar transporter [Sphingobacteriales bacterium]|nr:sugar transporter [Sphingobacteriales bacterium]
MKIYHVILLLSIILFSSCQPARNLVYFSENANGPKISNEANTETRIQQNDLLNISVSSLSVESNALFNQPSTTVKEGYRVDKTGSINFPVVGKIKVEGLTLDQSQETIARKLDLYVKNATVNVKFLNFKVTVIGEVNRPSTFTVTDERINLLEALGLAGDMTVYGKRENVLVIRENAGERTMARINLNNKDVLRSPYFNLKQNDVIYVEPVKSKAAQASQSNRVLPLVAAGVSLISAVILAFYRLNQ